ncbi:MAG: LysM peptidoglycan-binding domain-containing protein [Candidatus Marinimicrobia bacterium]|nr:LysM peptidoglycan-binding domain-containing protein [Candidatus Neomarinimicrobiota bacterium]
MKLLQKEIISLGTFIFVMSIAQIWAIPSDTTGIDSIEVEHASSNGEVDNIHGEINSIANGQYNRIPLILSEAKSYFVEAVIADKYGDTLEVIYLIDKIVDLLEGAEQLGELSAEDQEEFDRFEKTLLHVYENHLETMDQVETPIAIASLKDELSAFLEPLEIEINGSKFRVIDDRDGHIPLIANKRVDQAIKFFQTKGRRNFEIWLSRYPVYGDLIIDILKKNELPEELIFHAMVESGLNPKAYSRAHAAGMWQFVSATAKKYGLNRNWWVDERRDPVKSTQAAADYLKDLYLEFDDWYLAIAAYNAGSGRVNRAIQLHQTRDFWRLNSLPRETKNHLSTFLATAIIARNPEEYGFDITSGEPFIFDEVTLDRSADLTVLANCAGISVKELKIYNPDLRQFATPPDEPYTLKIPPQTQDRFLERFTALPDEQRFAPQYIIHRVKKGENLWLIARKYNVSLHDIVSVNKIKIYTRLQIGHKLTIPVPGTQVSTLLTTTAGNEEKTIYKVKRGDTLSYIALRFGTTARRIRQLNGLRYGAIIYQGQKLTVPSTSRGSKSLTEKTNPIKELYTVRKGDTLGRIALRYGTSVSKIKRWNGIKRGDYIYPGQKLVIFIQESSFPLQ